MTEPDGTPPPDLVTHAPAGPVAVLSGLGKAYRGWLAGLGFVVLFILVLLWGANRPANPTFADASKPAGGKPAAGGAAAGGFADKKIGVGGRCARVLVADTKDKRVEGLRHRDNLKGYDGMVFEFGQAMNHEKTRFTMSEVRFPLTIGFYDQSGARVDSAEMETCSGSEATCPSYGSKADFNIAIEAPRGTLPDGPITACAPS